jgi:transcriptional regulator with PAS, ATPase and Fis domain
MDTNYTIFFNETDCSITVCDTKGSILFMNEKSCKSFEKYGGRDLIGKNLFDCHNQNSCNIIKELLRENKSNTYTVTKNNKKKLIHQAPWHKDGKVMGLIEFSIDLPEEIPGLQRLFNYWPACIRIKI